MCVLTAQNSSNTPVSCGNGSGTDTFVLAMDPLLAIYALRVQSSGVVQLNAADPSRPVACTADADCLAPGIPLGAVTNSYTCQYGLCQLKQSCIGGACTPWDGVLLTYDILTLCQAYIPWPDNCPYITSQPFANRIAEVADLCGSHATCATVPPDCRQPNTASSVDAGLPGSGVDAGT